MITRRALLGAAGAMVAAGKKRKRRTWPVGWQQSFFPVIIVTAGPGFQGVFAYSPGPGFGNLVASTTSHAGTDPFGNAYLAGQVSYALADGIYHASSLNGGVLTFWHAASAAGPWTADATFSVLFPGGLTLNTGLTINSNLDVPGGLSTGAGLGIQTLVNGSTINTAGLTMRPVTAAASVTGIILQAGTFDGQTIELPSDAGAGVTITFAAAGTSHVKTGVGTVIQPGSTLVLKWVAATSLWYPVQ